MSSLEDYLKEVEARVNVASLGPWQHGRLDMQSHHVGGPDGAFKNVYVAESKDSLKTDAIECRTGRPLEDAQFVSNSRTDIPKLLEIIKAYQELVEKKDEFLKSINNLPFDPKGIIGRDVEDTKLWSKCALALSLDLSDSEVKLEWSGE